MYSNRSDLPTEIGSEITCEDHSYPSPVLQIKWRIEDLLNRLEEITNDNNRVEAHHFMGCRFSDVDLRLAMPNAFLDNPIL